MTGSEQLEIRSFRVVFAFERRLFKIDRWRLPLPYGVPVRALAYAAAALLAVLVAGALPGVALVMGAVPAPVRFVLLPGLVAMVLSRVRVDGRPAHRFVASLARHRLSPKVVDAFMPSPAIGSMHAITDDVVLAAGGPEYRPGVVTGPVTVVLGQPARARERGRTLELTPIPGAPLRRGRRIALKAGQRIVVRKARS